MTLFGAKCFIISIKGIIRTNVYLQPEVNYGTMIIYDSLEPKFVFEFLDVNACNAIKEIDYYISKYHLDLYRLTKNILKLHSNLSIRPQPKRGYLIYFKIDQGIKKFDLSPLDIDYYWNHLSSYEIKSIIMRSKRRWYDL